MKKLFKTFLPLFLLLNFQSFSQYSNDVAVGPFLSFPALFHSGISYNIKAKVTNAGTVNQTNVPLAFSVNGLVSGTGLIPFLNSGTVDSVSFPWIPPAAGFYTLRVYSSMANDQNRMNDTVTTTIYVLPGNPSGVQATICRSGLNIMIPDNNPAGIYDTINVNIPNALAIWDVNVRIDTLLHTWLSDILISVIHNSVIDTIFAHQGGSSDNLIKVTFNDSAIPPPPPPPPYNNITIKPFRPLSIFNGYFTNGQWLLHIADLFVGDIGYLKGWCIQIVYQPGLGINNGNEVPHNYFLSQNYPNPFNPVTIISYGIPKIENVMLKVYDMLGRELYTLVNQTKQAGVYYVKFDASALASGVYFYKLEAGSFITAKKFTLLK